MGFQESPWRRREMKIAINKVHFPVTTLGYGRRLAIWMQGCSIRCAGCINKDTWDRTKEHETTLGELLKISAEWLALADGVTISGGEPFDQPEALAALVEAIRASNAGDVLVYTGYRLHVIQQSFAAILAQIDVLISEPYRRGDGDSLALRGSDNQRISLLTPVARQRYREDIDRCEWQETRRLDLILTENELWLAGIPRTGEMARLKAKLKTLGYSCAISDEPQVRA
jgi:anaerobic ribonucleoside-triphosphate reductase activating protein